MFILGYIGSIIMGLTLGLLGGGGSILIVPILVYLFGIAPSIATGYSLFIVGLAAMIGAHRYSKQNLIDYKTGAIFALPAFLGVFSARHYVVPSLPQTIISIGSVVVTKDALIMLVFAVVMLLASISMIRGRKATSAEDEKKVVHYNYPLIILEGLIVGLVTGFVGAGGGFLIIPALVILANLPMKMAVGTSLMIISFKSLLGFLGDIGENPIDWTFLLSVAAVATVGIVIGSHYSKRVSAAKLKPAFGWFVLVMGSYILYMQVTA